MRTPPLRWRWMLTRLLRALARTWPRERPDVLAAIESLRQTEVEGFRQLIVRDAELAIATDAPDDSGNWVTTVTSETEVPPDFFSHLMGFQYMQTVLMVFLLVAFLLNLGATLWLAFSDKWRS